MFSYIISVVYMLCFIKFHTHMECIRRWKFIKNKKREK